MLMVMVLVWLLALVWLVLVLVLVLVLLPVLVLVLFLVLVLVWLLAVASVLVLVLAPSASTVYVHFDLKVGQRLIKAPCHRSCLVRVVISVRMSHKPRAILQTISVSTWACAQWTIALARTLCV